MTPEQRLVLQHLLAHRGEAVPAEDLITALTAIPTTSQKQRSTRCGDRQHLEAPRGRHDQRALSLRATAEIQSVPSRDAHALTAATRVPSIAKLHASTPTGGAVTVSQKGASYAKSF